MRHGTFLLIAAGAALLPALAHAQGGAAIDARAEVTTDDRRRGLSWSDGDPSISAGVGVQAGGFSLDAQASALRGARRHGGADLGVDLGARYTAVLGGGVRATGGATWHLFDRDGLSYAEVEGALSYTLGPARVTGSAAWAPSQDAIGDDNLYLRAGAEAGIPATPYTVYAHVGRSIGPEGRARANRLRPGGDYNDYRLGVDRVTGPLTLGVQLTATSVRQPADNADTRLLALARIAL